MTNPMPELPGEVAAELNRFVEAAKTAWGGNLRSIVLYGSAAEGRLRKTSDVNVLVVLRAFDREQTDQIREPLRYARAAIQLGIMILLETEISEAALAFGVKFDDIQARHCILHGDDPFATLDVPRAAALARLRQVLLNLRLRLRERYASVGLREEQLARVAADMAGPLRACAATLCRLEGKGAENPKAALERVVKEMGNAEFAAVLPVLSEAREQGALDAGVAGDLIITLMDLAGALQSRADRLE